MMMRNYRNHSAKLNRSLKQSEIVQNYPNTQNFLAGHLESYTKPSAQRKSKTAGSFRNKRIDQINSSLELRKKIEPKTPILRNSSTQSFKNQKIKKLQNLGLEDFMKELIIGNNNSKMAEGDYSSHIIEALNKTYVQQNKISSPKRALPGSFSKRRASPIFKAPRVDWNPQKQGFEGQFKELDSFVPNYMFPCRKSQTSRLKSRNFGSYQNGLKSSRTVQKVRVSVHENPIQEMKKQINLRSKNMSSKGKRREKTFSNQKLKYTNEKRVISSYSKTQSPIKGKKAQIYY